MTKEYKIYRFLVMIYVVFIANFAVLYAEGVNYYIWFCSSIGILTILLIYERDKLLNLIKHPTEYKFSRESIYLLIFIYSYPEHYQLFRHIDYAYVVLLQLINVLLFIIIFCVKKRTSNFEKS